MVSSGGVVEPWAAGADSKLKQTIVASNRTTHRYLKSIRPEWGQGLAGAAIRLCEEGIERVR
jgi:hypothetical protein